MPLPFVPYVKQERRGLLDLYNNSLYAAREFEQAVIPVEKIDCPVLLISGGKDTLWPAARMADKICDRAGAKGSRSKWCHLCFPDGGHLPDEEQRVRYIGRNGIANMVSPSGAMLKFIEENK